MSLILAILFVWVVVIPAAVFLIALVRPPLAARRTRSTLARLERDEVPRLWAVQAHRPAAVRRFAR